MIAQLLNYYCYLLVYAFIGWCCECAYCSIHQKRFINRGFLNGPVCPIYGFGALLVILLLLPFAADPIMIFILGVVLTSGLEYFTSYALEMIFHAKWWDYSSYPYNIKGRVCLKNSLMFGLMCIVAVYFIHPFLVGLVAKIAFDVKIVLLSVASVIIVTDMVITVHAMLRLHGKLAQLASIRKELEGVLATEGVHALAELVEDRLAESARTITERLETRFKAKLAEKTSIWQNRLLKAFPDLEFHYNNEHLLILKKTIEDRKMKLKKLKKK